MRAEWNVETPRLYDESTGETITVFAPLAYKEEFNGYSDVIDDVWAFGHSGDASCGLTDPVIEGGVVRAALSNANEGQYGRIDLGDVLHWCIGHGLNFEARVRLHVVPSAAAVSAQVGICTSFNSDPDAVTASAWFRVDGSGAVTVEADDGTHETSKVATGVTLTTDTWAVLRIDCSSTSALRFYVNGTRVAEATTFNASADTSLLVQPTARIAKATGTGVGTIDVDYIFLWQSERSA